MGKLYIESLEKRVRLKKIASAVYTVLKQTDNLKAELIFSEDDKMRALNRDTRGVDSITDVLSYPMLDGHKGEILKVENHLTELDGKYIFIGSIVLCESKIKEQAKELGHSEVRERTYLIVHGLMHLFGYDHMKEKDKVEMREKEKQALALLGIVD
jgi:probable rRNA maturation factor